MLRLNKSMLCMVSRLTACLKMILYPQPQIGRRQLSIDICCPSPGCGKRQMSIDGTDRRTDVTHTLHHVLCGFCGSVNNTLWIKKNRTLNSCPILKRSSSIAVVPRDASCQLKSCQSPRNSAETTCMTSSEQIEVIKLEGYSGPMCNKHVHSTMTRSSRFHRPIGVKQTYYGRVVNITCIPTTCCGENF